VLGVIFNKVPQFDEALVAGQVKHKCVFFSPLELSSALLLPVL
jgi:hypothetical protein